VLYKPSIIRNNTIPVKIRRILLVDYENLPTFISRMNSTHIAMMSDIWIFLCENHPLEDKPISPVVTRIIRTVSNLPNGSDVCIIMFLASLLSQGAYDEYIIATEDKFADVLVDHAQYPNYGMWKAAKTRRVRSVKQL